MLPPKNSYTALYLTFTLFWGLCYGFVLLSSAAGAGGLPDGHVLEPGAAWLYQWETTVLLNEKGASEKDVGFSVSSEVLVESKWGTQERLLKIQLKSPKLFIKSRKAPSPEGFVAHTSNLDSNENHPFYVVWNRGKVEKILLAKDETLSLANIKKGIASLFQFQLLDQETNETDASGHCDVSYKSTSPTTIEKSKYNCLSDDLTYIRNPEILMGTQVDSLRKTTYTLDAQSKYIHDVTAKERHEMFISVREEVGNKVETRQTLKLVKTQPTDVLFGSNMENVLNNIAQSQEAVFTRESLVTEKEILSDDDKKTFAGMVNEYRDNLKHNLLGTLSPTKVFLQLLSVVRRSNKEDIVKAVGGKKNKKILNQLYDILGYAQTLEAHEAAMKKLHFDDPKHEELSERYLWALSMSSQPNPEIITDILNRYKKIASIPAKVQETLIYTIATMTYRLKKLPTQNRNKKLQNNVEESIINLLEASQGDERYVYLNALRNLRSETSIKTLLKIVKSGTAKEGVLAWKAIRSMDSTKWSKEVTKAAYKTFLQLDKKHDSSSRTLALDIIMESDPSDDTITDVLYFLSSKDKAFEVKQYVLQTLKMMSDSCSTFRNRLARIVIADKKLNNYEVMAQRGLSTALKRPFLESSSSNGSLLTVQEMNGGIVKRGIVNVVMAKDGVTQEIFSLGIFSGGLSSFLSSDSDESSGEVATAGMELSVLGTHVRPFVFFSGQGELMGHVWSGTASERTSAYQALAMLQDHMEYLRLGTGFIAELDTKGGTSFDLSGRIEFSLWNRNAESLVEKSAGIIITGLMKVDTSFVKSQAEFSVSIEPKLKLQTDIDFSSNVNLCMRLTQPDSIYRHNIFKIERIPGSKHRLRKVKYKKYTVPGKTYSLNKKNNDMCNVIFKNTP